MQDNYSIGFIGGGRISYLLLERLKKADALPEKIVVTDPNLDRREIFKSIHPDKIDFRSKNSEAVRSRVIFLAVHPPIIKEVLAQIKKNLIPESVLISLAPVVKISDLQQLAGGFDKIVRMIPNAPSIIGKGYNPVCFAESISVQEKRNLLSLFNNWGKTPEVEEDRLEAYAILTAMGPTYFWFQWLELQKLGKKFNLNEDEIKSALHEMILGSSDLLFDSEYSAKDVLDMIPVKPLQEEEANIRNMINSRLQALHSKLAKRK
jgi:pyrroline-5-carboxylate reductase